MPITISTIKDDYLRKAAEKADESLYHTSADTMGNGKLDSDEISAFLAQAQNLGCDMSDALDIAGKSGIKKEGLKEEENLWKQREKSSYITTPGMRRGLYEFNQTINSFGKNFNQAFNSFGKNYIEKPMIAVRDFLGL